MMPDGNTAALRNHHNQMDKNDRGAAALFDAADYLANEEIDSLFIDGDKLGTAVFEYDINIWPDLVRAIESMDAGMRGGDPLMAEHARFQALEALAAIRRTVRTTLMEPTVRRIEQRLAEEAA